jgi:GNAT superfamily N-acetyltransferase
VTRVRLSRIEADELDDELAVALAAIDSAALDGVPLRRHTGRTFQLEGQDRYGEGPDHAVWLAHADGELAGYAALSLNRFANLDGAKVLGAVHPAHRPRGIGRAPVAEAESATDRPRLRAPAWVRTAGEHAVPAMGYQRSQSHQVLRPPAAGAWVDTAGRRAAHALRGTGRGGAP